MNLALISGFERWRAGVAEKSARDNGDGETDLDADSETMDYDADSETIVQHQKTSQNGDEQEDSTACSKNAGAADAAVTASRDDPQEEHGQTATRAAEVSNEEVKVKELEEKGTSARFLTQSGAESAVPSKAAGADKQDAGVQNSEALTDAAVADAVAAENPKAEEGEQAIVGEEPAVGHQGVAQDHDVMGRNAPDVDVATAGMRMPIVEADARADTVEDQDLDCFPAPNSCVEVGPSLVRISGMLLYSVKQAQGTPYDGINGVFERTDRLCNGRCVYQKRGSDSICMWWANNSGKLSWIVGPADCGEQHACIMPAFLVISIQHCQVALTPDCLPVGTEVQWAFVESSEASPDKAAGPWFVYDYLGHSYTAQPGVEVVPCSSEPSRKLSSNSSGTQDVDIATAGMRTPIVFPTPPPIPAGFQDQGTLPKRFSSIGRVRCPLWLKKAKLTRSRVFHVHQVTITGLEAPPCHLCLFLTARKRLKDKNALERAPLRPAFAELLFRSKLFPAATAHQRPSSRPETPCRSLSRRDEWLCRAIKKPNLLRTRKGARWLELASLSSPGQSSWLTATRTESCWRFSYQPVMSMRT